MLTFDPGLKVIGVLSIPDFGDENTVINISHDLDALQDGGVDALLVENIGYAMPAHDDNVTEFFRRTLAALRFGIRLPFGVALLPEYEHARMFRPAEEFDADFVWFDTFVDAVSPRYTSSEITIQPRPREIGRYKTRPLFTEIQPWNFYAVLGERPLEESAAEAIANGADSIAVVRHEKYREDDFERIRQVVGPEYPLGITGGLKPKNIGDYLGRAQYAVVFGFFKKGDYESPVDITKVKEVMRAVR